MEYFENQRDKYINTGIIPNQDNVVMEIKVRPTSGSWYIWQNRDSVNGIYGITGSRNNNTIGIRCANDDRQITSTITRNETHIYIIRATYNNGNATLYVKDLTANQEAVNTGTYTYVQQTLPLWMFGNQQGNYIQGDNRVYYAKMWVGGDLVMDYEPGIQDGVAGFYDNVTKTFKTPLDGN